MSADQRHGDRGSLEADDLAAPRLAKIDAMRAAGDDPYPARFERTARAAELIDRHEDLGPGSSTGETVTVAGRLVGKRDIGKLVFAPLMDGSGTIQLFARADELDDFAEFAALDVGDWVGATGEVITTRNGELSVDVTEWSLLAKSLRSLPEKWHGLTDTETRYRQRYLDLISSEEARRTMQVRVAAVRALREAFWERGFIEVEGPALESQPSGAIARPFRTHHQALDLEMYLRIAMELPLKKLVIGGVEKVFELGKTFRNEGVSTRHNPEFTMLEAYQAFVDYTDFMALIEQVVAEVAQEALGTTSITYQGTEIELAPPWKRVRLEDAVSEAMGRELTIDAPVSELAAAAEAAGGDPTGTDPGRLLTEVFEAAVEPELSAPTFVMDYPTSVSPFSKEHSDRPGVTQRFEAFVAGWEIANAYSELNDPLEQRARFEAQAALRAEGDEEAHRIDESFLQALEYGLPPTAGLGIGVDRLVMVLADQPSIREVILFPTLRPE